MLSVPLLPPQEENSSHSSPAPACCPFHRRQSSRIQHELFPWVAVLHELAQCGSSPSETGPPPPPSLTMMSAGFFSPIFSIISPAQEIYLWRTFLEQFIFLHILFQALDGLNSFSFYLFWAHHWDTSVACICLIPHCRDSFYLVGLVGSSSPSCASSRSYNMKGSQNEHFLPSSSTLCFSSFPLGVNCWERWWVHNAYYY